MSSAELVPEGLRRAGYHETVTIQGQEAVSGNDPVPPGRGATRWSWWNDIRSLGVFGRMWIVGNIAFSAGRALIAWPTLGRYGVDPWIFLALDIVTAPPYGVAQAVTVKVLRDPDRPASDALGWAGVVFFCFFAPYVYIFIASGSMSTLAYVGVFAWMAIFGTLAIVKIVKQVRSAGPETEPPSASSGSPDEAGR